MNQEKQIDEQPSLFPICYQELFFGILRNLDPSVISLGEEQQTQEMTVHESENANHYTTICDYHDKIYQSEIKGKTVHLDIVIAQDPIEGPQRFRFIFTLEDQLAQQGCWFQLLDEMMIMVMVDLRGKIYVVDLADFMNPQCQIIKIQDVAEISIVESIQFDSISSSYIRFAAASSERIIYIEYQPKLNENQSIFAVHSSAISSGLIGMINQFRGNKYPFNYITKMIKLSNNHTFIMTRNNDLKIFMHNKRENIFKFQGIEKNFKIDDSMQLANFKYFNFNNQSHNNRCGHHYRGTFIIFSQTEIQIYEIDFLQIQNFNKISNIEDFNVNSDRVQFEITLSFIQKLNLKDQNIINDIMYIENHLVVQSINSNVFTINLDDSTQGLVLASTLDPQLDFRLKLHITHEKLIFGICERSIVVFLRLRSQLLYQNGSFFQRSLKLTNDIKKQFTKDRQNDLAFCVQAINQNKMDDLTKHMNSQNIMAIITNNQGFREEAYRLIIEGTKQNQKFYEIIDSILMENYDCIIFLNDYFQQEESIEQLNEEIQILAFQIEKFIFQFKNDPPHYSSKNYHGKCFRNIQYDFLITITSQMFNILVIKLLLLIHRDESSDINQYERLFRNLAGILYFLEQKQQTFNFLKLLTKEREIDIFHNGPINLINLLTKLLNYLFYDLDNIALQNIPLILSFSFNQVINIMEYNKLGDYSTSLNLAIILNFTNPFVQYQNAICQSHLNLQEDFLATIIHLSEVVDQINDFERGPWYDKFYQKDIYLSAINNNLSQLEKFIILLVKNQELNEISKYQVAKHFYNMLPQEPTEEINHKNLILQQTIFRALFESALKLKKDTEVLDLLQKSDFIKNGYDEFSVSKRRISLMEQFIDTYFQNFRYEDLMAQKLQPKILKEIFYHLELWNKKMFKDQAAVQYDNLEDRPLNQISLIFYKQDKLLFSQGLPREVNLLPFKYKGLKILYSLHDLLTQFQQIDLIYNKKYFYQILLEQINVLSQIVQRAEQIKLNQKQQNESFIPSYFQENRALNLEQNQNDNCFIISCVKDLLICNIKEIKQVTIPKLEIQNFVYLNYKLKLDSFEDIALTLIDDSNYDQLIVLWSTGELFFFIQGIQTMINELRDQPTLIHKYLKLLLHNDAFRNQKMQILNLMVRTLLIQKLVPEFQNIDEFIRQFDLDESIFKVFEILSCYKAINQPSKKLLDKFQQLANKRNLLQIETQRTPEFVPCNPICNYQNQRDVLNYIQSNTFLQEKFN